MKILLSIGAIVVFLVTICVSPLSVTGKTEQLSNPFSPVADNPVYIPIMVGDSSSPASTPSPTPNPTASPTSTPRPTSTPSPSPTVVPPSGNAIIADHTVISAFSSIPDTYVNDAAAIKTLFMHQSTGNNINSLGLECLQGTQDDAEHPEAAECLTYQDYYYDRRNWTWKVWDNPLADAIAKTDQWVDVVNAQQQNFQVLGMKFCYVDGWNQDFNYYREKMEQLESTYPNKTFIWATQVLWSQFAIESGNVSDWSYEGIQTFNQQLRAYARANNKILYDLADIESHDSNGNLCQYNGIDVLCEEYFTGYGGGSGGHPNIPGSIRMAKGFWWLMARISGWDGVSQVNPN